MKNKVREELRSFVGTVRLRKFFGLPQPHVSITNKALTSICAGEAGEVAPMLAAIVFEIPVNA